METRNSDNLDISWFTVGINFFDVKNWVVNRFEVRVGMFSVIASLQMKFERICGEVDRSITSTRITFY